MAIRYVTGRVGALEGQLLADVAERMRRDESTLYIVVPKHLTLEEQGVFQLGYYHQRQALFTKKEEKENG